MAVATLVAIALITGVLWRAHAQEQRRTGQVPTGRVSRWVRLMWMSARSALPYGWAKLHDLFVGRARRRELAETAHVKSSEQIVQTLGGMKGVMMKFTR